MKAYHLPVFVEQDSNVGAMGEWWFGNSEIGQGTKVFVSTGDVRWRGIVVDGKIQRGALGAVEKLGTCLLILKDLSASVEIKAVWSYTVQKKLF